jgi:uncharacterized protein
MRPDIKRLVELQAVDVRLGELRGRLKALPQQLAIAEQGLAAAKQQLAAAKEALTASVKARKTYEMDVETWKEKARKYREQSFAVKTNEAYKALQHEIQHAEGEVAQAEDSLLERMVAGEEFERQVKTAERAIAVEERTAQAERDKIKAEQAALQVELATKESERQQEVSDIPENILARYESIAQRRHGIGVAEVRDESCRQCGVRIVPHVFQELRRENSPEIFECETCTRILYYVEPPPAPPVAPAGSPSSDAEIPANES